MQLKSNQGVLQVCRQQKFQQLLYRLKTILTDDFIRADKKKEFVYKLRLFFHANWKSRWFSASINQQASSQRMLSFFCLLWFVTHKEQGRGTLPEYKIKIAFEVSLRRSSLYSSDIFHTKYFWHVQHVLFCTCLPIYKIILVKSPSAK